MEKFLDAMGGQTEIAAKIIEQGADYVLALKGNPGDLHVDVAQLFSAAQNWIARNFFAQNMATEISSIYSNNIPNS